jgi:hypothetical protein
LPEVNLTEAEETEKGRIITGFWDHIGYKPVFLDPSNEQIRYPMYLKGTPENITRFILEKENFFYYV